MSVLNSETKYRTTSSRPMMSTDKRLTETSLTKISLSVDMTDVVACKILFLIVVKAVLILKIVWTDLLIILTALTLILIKVLQSDRKVRLTIGRMPSTNRLFSATSALNTSRGHKLMIQPLLLTRLNMIRKIIVAIKRPSRHLFVLVKKREFWARSQKRMSARWTAVTASTRDKLETQTLWIKQKTPIWKAITNWKSRMRLLFWLNEKLNVSPSIWKI
jgi:hypothetical protein